MRIGLKRDGKPMPVEKVSTGDIPSEVLKELSAAGVIPVDRVRTEREDRCLCGHVSTAHWGGFLGTECMAKPPSEEPVRPLPRFRQEPGLPHPETARIHGAEDTGSQLGIEVSIGV